MGDEGRLGGPRELRKIVEQSRRSTGCIDQNGGQNYRSHTMGSEERIQGNWHGKIRLRSFPVWRWMSLNESRFSGRMLWLDRDRGEVRGVAILGPG